MSNTGVVGRSASAGGISNLAKDDNDAEMNGPLVPEKILKSVQVFKYHFMHMYVCFYKSL